MLGHSSAMHASVHIHQPIIRIAASHGSICFCDCIHISSGGGIGCYIYFFNLQNLFTFYYINLYLSTYADGSAHIAAAGGRAAAASVNTIETNFIILINAYSIIIYGNKLISTHNYGTISANKGGE